MNQNGGSRITSLKVQVGHFSGVVPDALEFAFSCLKKDTPAANALLEILYLFPKYVCGHCNQLVEEKEMVIECPFCHSCELSLTQGYELHLASMEIEKNV